MLHQNRFLKFSFAVVCLLLLHFQPAFAAGIRAGDLNGQDGINLADAIIALQANTRITAGQSINPDADVDQDGRIGLAEAIYILQVAAGLRAEGPLRYSVSGTITAGGTALSGVKVALSGASDATATTDHTGHYRFGALISGDYTVAPLKEGYTFNAKPVSISNDNQTRDFSLPAAPTNLSAAPGDGQAVITWNPVAGEVSYNIYWSASPKVTKKSGAKIEGVQSPYKHTGLTNGATYYYVVAAANGDGEGADSPQAIALPQADNEPPTAPTDLSATTVSSSQIDLTWSASSDNVEVAGYKIYEGTTLVDEIIDTTFSRSGLNSSTEYCYAVSAFDARGNESDPAQACATTLSPTVYAISGRVTTSAETGLAGVEMSLSGASTASTTTDASGNYIFLNLLDGDYTVTAARSDCTFSGNSLSVTINGESQINQNITATGKYSISGRVTYNGSGLSEVTVSLEGDAAGSTTTGDNGNFTFTGLLNGSYTVTPSRADCTFSPAAQVTVNGTDQTVDDLVATGKYSISGTATYNGSGLSGVAVSLGGDATASTTTDASGNYIFPNLLDGDYIVTAARSDCTFSVNSLPVTINGASQIKKNFTATGKHSISGTVTSNSGGLSGVTMDLTGGAIATVETDIDGNYTFSNLLNGDYTVTPSKQGGYSFDPESQEVTINGADQPNQDFTAAGAYAISGKVTLNGVGLKDVSVRLSLNGIVVQEQIQTNDDGEYEFSGLLNGTYLVTPSKEGCGFEPEDRSVAVNGASRTAIDFIVQLYAISGRVTIGDAGLEEVTMTLSLSDTLLQTETTDQSGYYTFSGLLGGDYMVTPSREGYVFTPENWQGSVNENLTKNFTATELASAHSISGRVTLNGAGLAGVAMALTGTATASTITGDDGGYSFDSLANGSYAVTPSKEGYSFDPQTINGVNISGIDQPNQNFTANAVSSTRKISGVVSDGTDGLQDVPVTLSGPGVATQTTLTDDNGYYTFAGLTNGTYRISARKSPYAFVAREVTITNTAPPPDQNFIGTYQGCPCAALSAPGVTISVPSGLFKDNFSVTLSTSIPGAQIRYTTAQEDGSIVTSASSLYSGSIAISGTTRLIAAAFIGNEMQGIPSAAIYVKMDPAFVTTSHDLPVIILASFRKLTQGTGKPPNEDVDLPTSYEVDRPFVDVGILAFDPADHGGSVTISPTSLPTPSVASLAAFHVRGNSSSSFEKIPYRLELRYETGTDRDCPMFGMPAESDWALISPYPDKALIRNNFVYELGRDMGMQAPRVKNAEVYLSKSVNALADRHYQGVYQLVETIKNHRDRLNLKQLEADKPDHLEEPKISGGYIFKFDWLVPMDDDEAKIEPPTGTNNPWNYLFLRDPSPVAAVQTEWIKNRIAGLHNTLRPTVNADPTTGYPAYINEQSFIDTVILNELTRNLDALLRSQYFYKDRDKDGIRAKIFAGPLWDFDLTAGVGSNSTYANTSTSGWQYESNASRLSQTADWFPKLIANATFRANLVARWKSLRQAGGYLSNAEMDNRIDELAAGLSNGATRNFNKWDILTTYDGKVGYFNSPNSSTWAEQITLMKTWLHDRAAWLDTQWQ